MNSYTYHEFCTEKQWNPLWALILIANVTFTYMLCVLQKCVQGETL